MAGLYPCRAHPVRSLPPDLAGIRADKSNRLTFPCKAQWLSEAFYRVLCDTCLPLRGQHTRACVRLRVSRLTAHLDRCAGTKTPTLYGFVGLRWMWQCLRLQRQNSIVGDVVRWFRCVQGHFWQRYCGVTGAQQAYRASVADDDGIRLLAPELSVKSSDADGHLIHTFAAARLIIGRICCPCVDLCA